jgi:hypothetical protein
MGMKIKTPVGDESSLMIPSNLAGDNKKLTILKK